MSCSSIAVQAFSNCFKAFTTATQRPRACACDVRISTTSSTFAFRASATTCGALGSRLPTRSTPAGDEAGDLTTSRNPPATAWSRQLPDGAGFASSGPGFRDDAGHPEKIAEPPPASPARPPGTARRWVCGLFVLGDESPLNQQRHPSRDPCRRGTVYNFTPFAPPPGLMHITHSKTFLLHFYFLSPRRVQAPRTKLEDVSQHGAAER